MEANTVLIRLDQVGKWFIEGGATRVVLQHVCTTLGRREFVVLLGRSGSGKSTLLNVISGIDTPSSGRIWIDDQEMTGLSERDRTLFRRQKIGFIFQFFNLIPTLTVLENLLLPLELNGRYSRDDRARAIDLLEQ